MKFPTAFTILFALIVVVAAPLATPAFLAPTGACGMAQVIE